MAAFLSPPCSAETERSDLEPLSCDLTGALHNAHADSVPAESLPAINLRSATTTQGWYRVDYALRLMRECETGEQVLIGDDKSVAGGAHSWVDRTTQKGRTYTYTVDYANARCHESEALLIYVPKEGDVSPGAVSDPLFVEVFGIRVQGVGGVFMLEARPSIPGGTFTWTTVDARGGTTLAVSSGRALLRGEHSTQPLIMENMKRYLCALLLH